MGLSLTEFMQFVEKLDTRCNETLGIANREYAAGENKFYNFDTIASLMSQGERTFTPHDIASVYFMKHAMSIIRGISEREDMSGRYVDAINYLKLMAGMYYEQSIPRTESTGSSNGTPEDGSGPGSPRSPEETYRGLSHRRV